MKWELKKQMNLDKNTRFVLLRHGETVYNIEKRLQSSKDSLTARGKLQIENLRQNLLKFNFEKIISSDETRAIETAKIISSWSNSSFEIEPLIKEKNSGSFSDKLVSEVDWSLVKGTFFDKKTPLGESVNDVVDRAKDFFKKMNEFEQNKTFLVVSHGTLLRVLICIIFNKDIEDYLLNYEFPNATYLVIKKSGDGNWELEESSLIKKK